LAINHECFMTATFVDLHQIPRVCLLDARLHALTEAQCVDFIACQLRAGRGGWVVTHNLDHLRRLRHDPDFRACCASANLVVADGMPLVWASKLAGQALPQRVAGSNLIFSLCAAAARDGRSVFLLGGNPGTADAAARRLQELHPSLKVGPACCPAPGFERDPQQFADVQSALLDARPDVVFVGLGSPKQEHLIQRMRPLLPSAWWLGIGISFSFVCGEVRRAPRWLQLLGLEWLHRLAQEPRRLARRYVIQGLPFACLLLLHALRLRLRAARPKGRQQPDEPGL
jgi:N-acetylglucosaminyldiphosphoundecaprenol N-acetyl-beta-D-mannosaminyltransferase